MSPTYRRRFLRFLGAIGITGLVGVGPASARDDSPNVGRILEVFDDGETGRLRRASDQREFKFGVSEDVPVDVEPGDSVAFHVSPIPRENKDIGIVVRVQT